MKKTLMPLLYENATLGEIGFTSAGGFRIAPGDQFPVNSNNQVPGMPSGQYATVSRIGQACLNAPTFHLQGYDINDCAYGTLQAVGEEAKWRTDGETIWTTLKIEDDDDYLSDAEVYRVFLYPLVAWYENRDDNMKAFRAKYQKNEATTDDCIRFSSAFHYGYAVNHFESVVVDGCGESLCLPAVEKDIVVASSNTASADNNGLPWQIASDVPNDLSMQSAIAGRYSLCGKATPPSVWGVVCEDGKTYDFAADLVQASEMTDYIDNPDFRDCLQQIVGYISSLFRTNNLVWDGKMPINQFLEQANVSMKRSNQQNIMLAGEPGAGKTLLGRMLAATLGLPCAVIRLGERFEKDELTQEIIATDHGFDSIKSQMYWYVRHGGILMFDDLSNADPNMFFSITGGLLESPYEYVVNQEKVKRHPLCIILATTNVGTIGSQPMNEALLTRFGGHYVVEKLSDNAFKQCIIERAQSNSGVIVKDKTQKAIADWTFNIFNAVSRAIKNVDRETADRLITMRAAIGTAEKILNAIADGFSVDCKRAAQQMMANILYTGGNPALQRAVSEAIDSTPALRI